MGRRRGRLPGGQLPAPVVGVERQATGTRSATSGGAAPEPLADVGYRLTGSSDLYASNGRRPYASVNFITAHDGFTLADLVVIRATSTTRPTARTTATASPTTAPGTAASEGPTDDPAIVAPRRATSAEPARDPVPVAGRPDAPGRRRDRTHPAGQQQRLLPGQRALVVRLGGGRRGAAGVHPPADRLPPGPPGVPSPALVPGPPDPRRRGPADRVVRPGRDRDGPRALERPDRGRSRGVPLG